MLSSLESAVGLKNPFAGNPDAVKEGGKTFDERCSECHGGDAMGMSGPDLTDDRWLYGGSDSETFQTVSKGQAGGPSPQHIPPSQMIILPY